jgi:hypothetical protein
MDSTTLINTVEYRKVRIVIPVVVGSSPISHPIFSFYNQQLSAICKFLGTLWAPLAAAEFISRNAHRLLEQVQLNWATVSSKRTAPRLLLPQACAILALMQLKFFSLVFVENSFNLRYIEIFVPPFLCTEQIGWINAYKEVCKRC